MVKRLDVVFDDAEFERLWLAKERSKLEWKQFIMLLAVRKFKPRGKN